MQGGIINRLLMNARNHSRQQLGTEAQQQDG